MKGSNTDKKLGIRNRMNWTDDDKFRDIRGKAQDEYCERRRGKKKKKSVKVPCYEVGDRVVLTMDGRESRKYVLVEVLDFEGFRFNSFRYFAVILKVTHKKQIERIGRLCTFREDGSGFYFGGGVPAHVPEEGITWLNVE